MPKVDVQILTLQDGLDAILAASHTGIPVRPAGPTPIIAIDINTPVRTQIQVHITT